MRLLVASNSIRKINRYALPLLVLAQAGYVTGSLTGCGTSPSTYREPGSLDIPMGKQHAESRVTTQQVIREPWDLWPYSRTLSGERLQSLLVLRGDESVKNNDRKSALSFYRQALKTTLVPEDREALVLRIASCEISLRNYRSALGVMSDYVRSLGGDLAHVNPRYAITFGYGYAGLGSIDQAVVWLKKGIEDAQEHPSLKASAVAALNRVLAGVTEDELEKIGETWRPDMIVAQAVAQERGARARSGSSRVVAATAQMPSTQVAQQGTEGEKHDDALFALLMPLTGPYKDLGESLSNGVNLAFAGAQFSGLRDASLAIKDTKGDPLLGAALTRELLGGAKPTLIFGAPRAEEVALLAPLALDNKIPLFSFSKRGELGHNGLFFRFAPTVEHQMNSLFGALRETGFNEKLGVLYPDTEQGRTYAESFVVAAKEARMQVGFRGAYKVGSETTLVQRTKELEKSGVKAVYIPDTLEIGARIYSQLSEQARATIRPLGLANWDSPQQLVQFSGVLRGAWIVSPFFTKSKRTTLQQFIGSYKARHGRDPDFIAAQGFDAGTMVFAALKRSREEEISFIDALHDINGYEGITGRISVSETGEVSRVFTVVELQQRGLSEVLLARDLPTAQLIP